MATPIRWPQEGLIVPNRGIDETVSPQQLPQDKWSSGFDAEPLPDGVRSRQGSSRSNTVPLQEVSISSEAGTDSREFNSGTHFWIAQSFTVGASDISVRRVAVRLKLSSGAAGSLTAGDVNVAIYNNSSGSPGAARLGADFANFSAYDPEDNITSEYKWFFFDLTTFTGNHTGTGPNDATLEDSAAPFTVDEQIGSLVRNTIKGSSAKCTDNTTTDITATMSGGTTAGWDNGDGYEVLPAEQLTSTNVFHLVVRYASAQGTGTNNISIEEDNSGNPYSGGQVNYSTDGSSWTPDANADLNFRIYDGDPDGSTPTITGIMDYRKSDAATTRHLVMADSELYKNVSGTMTAVSARERAAMTAGDDKLIDHTMGNDVMFMTNDTDIPKAFYVNASGTERWQNMGIERPTEVLTPNVAVENTNPLTADTYQIDWYLYNSETGARSDSRYLGVDTLQQVVGANEELTLTGFPTTASGGARENDYFDKIRVELKGAADTIYRQAKEFDVGDSEPIVIDGTDESFTTEGSYVHAVPPVCAAIQVAENRTFVLNVPDNPWRLQWSAIVGTTPQYESFPTANFRDFGRGDGDYGTALFFMPPRTLICGFKNSIYAIDARRPGISDRLKIASGIGVAGPQAGLVVGNRFYFVSDGAETRGMYFWESGRQAATLLPGLDDTFKALNQTRIQYASCAHLAPGDNRFQWWTLLSTAANSGDRILVYDYVLQAWTVYTKSAAAAAADVDGNRLGSCLGSIEASSQTAIYMGGRDGSEYQQDTGTSDAGKLYFGRFQMPAMDFGAPFVIKMMRWLDYVVEQKSAGAIAMITERDYGMRTPISTSLQHQFTGSSFTLDTSQYGGTDVMGSAGDTIERVAHRGRGKVFRPEFSSQDAWFLKGLAFGMQPTRKR